MPNPPITPKYIFSPEPTEFSPEGDDFQSFHWILMCEDQIAVRATVQIDQAYWDKPKAEYPEQCREAANTRGESILRIKVLSHENPCLSWIVGRENYGPDPTWTPDQNGRCDRCHGKGRMPDGTGARVVTMDGGLGDPRCVICDGMDPLTRQDYPNMAH
jgi:hypothetical protein